MNKKILKILIISTAVLVSLGIVGVVIFKSINNDTRDIPVETPKLNIEVTGKLLKYMEGFSNNYYIKYSGKFKDNFDNYKDAIVEVTVDGEKFAVRSTELNMYVICDGKTVKSISKEYKLIINMIKSAFNLDEYHLVQDIGQLYVKSYETKLNGIVYEVEEYSHYGNTLKYYFKEDDLKMVVYNDRTIKVLRLEKQTNKEMLSVPNDYKFVIT